MSKKKLPGPPPALEPEPEKKKDQHRSPHMVRLRADVFEAMKALAEEEDRPMTREVQQALIAWLKAKGRWDGSDTST